MVASLGSFHRKGGTDVPVADGGTGASTAAPALAALGHGTQSHLGIPGAGRVAQYLATRISGQFNTAGLKAFNDVAPTVSDGAQLATIAIAPKNASSTLLFHVSLVISTDGNDHSSAWLLDHGNVTRAAALAHSGAADQHNTLTFTWSQVAGGVSFQTWKVRVGSNVSQTRINSQIAGAARLYGGVMSSSIEVWEILPPS